MAYLRSILLAACFILSTVLQCRAVATTSINEVVAGKQLITRYDSNKVESLMKSDVIGYFKLEDIYNTDLKQKNYQKTDEYKEKLGQLSKLRDEALIKQYYVRFVGNDTFETKNVIYNYDIKKQGINFKLNTALDLLYQPKEIEGVLFKYLPTELYKRTLYSGDRLIDELLFIAMDEEHGALIENNKKLVDVIISFNVKDSSKQGDLEANCPAALYLANRDTGEIYFEKTYQCSRSGKIKEAKKAKNRKKQ